MFKIAQTRKEKKQVAIYWEEQRNLAAEMRDAFDKEKEDKYHTEFYYKEPKQSLVETFKEYHVENCGEEPKETLVERFKRLLY